MSGELPPQIQNQLAQLQQLQQQAQAVMTQKGQIEGLIRETEAALKELEKSPDDAVIYKSVGELLFKSEKPKLQEELEGEKGYDGYPPQDHGQAGREDPGPLHPASRAAQDVFRPDAAQGRLKSFADPWLSQDIAPGF